MYQTPIKNDTYTITSLMFELVSVLPQQVSYRFIYVTLSGKLYTLSVLDILILIDLWFLVILFFMLFGIPLLQYRLVDLYIEELKKKKN